MMKNEDEVEKWFSFDVHSWIALHKHEADEVYFYILKICLTDTNWVCLSSDIKKF